MSTFKHSSAMLLLLVTSVAHAGPITYTGSSLSQLPVHLSVTTDGTQGTLSMQNILSWEVRFEFTLPFGFQHFSSADPQSALFLEGSGLTANNSDLLFDFNSDSVLQFRRRMDPTVPGFETSPRYRLTGVDSIFNSDGPCFQCEWTSVAGEFDFRVPLSGKRSIARAETVAAIPEPPALLVAMVGLLGLSIRRRRQHYTSY